MGWRERRKCQGQPPLFVPWPVDGGSTAFGFPGPAAWSDECGGTPAAEVGWARI